MSESATPTAVPPAGIYQIDPAASSISFATRHMFGLGPVKGSLKVSAGQIVVAETPTASSVEATADAESFNTGSTQRDRQVRGRTFLHTERFPHLTYRSTSVRGTDAGWVVSGVLTAKGVDAPLDLTVTDVESTGSEVRISATGTVDRYLHGVKAMPGMAGRRLKLTLAVVAKS